MSENKEKKTKVKWTEYTFGPMPVPLKPFDLDPVTDIVVRKAVEDGAKNARNLSFYRTAVDWLGYEKGSIVIAGKIEEGRSFSFWTPKGPSALEIPTEVTVTRKRKTVEEDQQGITTPEPEVQPVSEAGEIPGAIYCQNPIQLLHKTARSCSYIAVNSKPRSFPESRKATPHHLSKRGIKIHRVDPFE